MAASRPRAAPARQRPVPGRSCSQLRIDRALRRAAGAASVLTDTFAAMTRPRRRWQCSTHGTADSRPRRRGVLARADLATQSRRSYAQTLNRIVAELGDDSPLAALDSDQLSAAIAGAWGACAPATGTVMSRPRGRSSRSASATTGYPTRSPYASTDAASPRPHPRDPVLPARAAVATRRRRRAREGAVAAALRDRGTRLGDPVAEHRGHRPRRPPRRRAQQGRTSTCCTSEPDQPGSSRD